MTGFSMLLLAIFAGRIWSIGLPIWDMLGRSFGSAVKRAVALLSVVWMTGVLAAQIHGGTAILMLIGLPHYAAIAFILTLIFGASRINLGFAARIFSLCLLGSSMVLVFALFHFGGASIYINAIPRFVSDMHFISPQEFFVTVVGVGFLVVTGADYQQFVIAARSRTDAVVGCGIAGVFLLLAGALPASTVIAARDAGILTTVADDKQIIPFLLSHISARISPYWGIALLLGLLSAALGSGAAIVRAMTSALASSISGSGEIRRFPLSAAIILLGGIVAARGQGIVDTMVELNIVYIASVAPIFVFLLLGVAVSASGAQKAIAAGFATSVFLYVAKWLGLVAGSVELFSLCIGIAVSVLVLEICRRMAAPAF